MKKRTIIGVALTLMLLSSFLVAATPTAAGTFSWTAFEPFPTGTNQVLEDCDIKSIAIAEGGDVIYVGGGGELLYRSTSQGEKWSTYDTDADDDCSDCDVDLVAVAPDDSDIVAYADTDADMVYVSTNGGSTFGTLDFETETDIAVINDITISAASAGINYIAVSGTDTDDEADVWYYDVGDASPVWASTQERDGFDTDAAANSTALAARFSPNFPSDQVMVALTAEWDGGGSMDYVNVEVFSFNQKKWNDDAGFDGYELALVSDDGITGINAGDLTLDPDYLGSDDAMRLSFVGLDIAGDSDATKKSGIHRADDTASKELKVGSTILISSIAYNGTTLIAGHNNSNVIRRSSDATATTPTVKTTRSNKRPGEASNDETQVAIGSDMIFAGGSGAQSAFAVSDNEAESFNDISLIDTEFEDLRDVAVSSDGDAIYMTHSDDGYGSVWRYASGWQRTLVTDDADELLVRVAPDDPDVVYVAEYDGTLMFYSGDGGTTRWQQRTSRYDIQDMAVEGDGTVAYILQCDNGKTSKSTNAGFTWAKEKSTSLNGGVQIFSLGEDKILVTSDDGYVSYSTDGGSSYTKISKQVDNDGSDTFATATGLDEGDWIFAATASDSDIFRWQIGTSSSWEKLLDGDGDDAVALILYNDVLYLVSEGSTQLMRSLSPTVGVPDDSYFSEQTSSVYINSTPQAIVAGPGSTKLYGVETDLEKIYTYTDTLTDAVPTLISPADGYVVPVNEVGGWSVPFTMVWEKPSSKVTGYDVRLMDEDGYKIDNEDRDGTTTTMSMDVYEFDVPLEPGKTYSWKVRVDDPVFSGWSETRTFSIPEADAAIPDVTVPAPAAPNVTVEPPAVTVEPAPPAPAPTVTVNVPPAPTPTPAIPQWMLWIIVAIGAILVIFLIVLIMRTRRVA
jgi:hypothetical protein